MHYKFLAAAFAIGFALASGTSHAAFDPENPAAIIAPGEYPGIVDSFIARAEFAQALHYAQEGLTKNPMSAQLKFQRCVALEKLGRNEEAIGGLRELISLYPEIPEPYNNLAVLVAKTGNVDEAESLLKKALALRPKFALAYKNLGDVYLARAQAAYRSSLEIAPKQSRLRTKLQALDALPR